MPRKTDGIPFEVHRSPKRDDDGNKVLYAITHGRQRTFEEMDRLVAMSSALRNGELQRSFDTFLDECVKWVSQGYRVQTPLGVFSLKLGMKRKITNPRDVRHDDVEFKGVDFKPSAEFIKGVKNKVRYEGFRYVHKADSSVLMANEEYMEQALQKSLKVEGGYTTVSSFMFYSGLTKYSATKMLRHWCYTKPPKLRERKIGHSIIYEVVETKNTDP